MSECECPIHRTGEVPTLPLGVPFAHRVSIESIPRHIAADIYTAHHSYMPETPTVNLLHHGIFLDTHLVGAITYRHPLISELNGVSGGKIVEVARICIGVDMSNLASCGFRKSQEKIIKSYCNREGIEIILTFVREGYDGGMIRALRDTGWKCDGTRETSQPGNRADAEIHDYDKDRWILELDSSPGEQQKLC